MPGTGLWGTDARTDRSRVDCDREVQFHRGLVDRPVPFATERGFGGTAHNHLSDLWMAADSAHLRGRLRGSLWRDCERTDEPAVGVQPLVDQPVVVSLREGVGVVELRCGGQQKNPATVQHRIVDSHLLDDIPVEQFRIGAGDRREGIGGVTAESIVWVRPKSVWDSKAVVGVLRRQILDHLVRDVERVDVAVDQRRHSRRCRLRVSQRSAS